MNAVFDQLRDQFTAFSPNLLAGLAVLVVGWLAAVLASAMTRKLLSKISVDNKIAQWMAGPDSKEAVPVEDWAGKAVFYLIMLVVLIAFLQTIRLNTVTDPLKMLVDPVVAYLPRLIGAGVLVLVAWLLATALKKVMSVILRSAKLDEKISGPPRDGAPPAKFSETFSELVYWLVFLFFVPSVLQALDMQSILVPVTTLFNKVFAFLPNLLSAGAIVLVGWFIARIVQRIVQSLLATTGLDRLSEKWGLATSLGQQRLSGVLSLILYYLILVPVVIAGLDALNLEAITRPASNMIGQFMDALPKIFAAGVVLMIALVLAKVAGQIVANVLAGVGFNNLPLKLGLTKQLEANGHTPALWMGKVTFAVIALFASVTAADILGLPAVSQLIRDFIVFAGHVLMGLIIFGLGLWLAQVVAQVISASEWRHALRGALVARIIILALAGAMALRQTGLANEIVNLAFGLTIGAVALAFAVAFGIGGRDMAARTLNDWREAEHPVVDLTLKPERKMAA